MAEDVHATVIEQLQAVMRMVTQMQCEQQAEASDFGPGLAYRTAIRVIADRRARAQQFTNRDLFGEPAWDILLDLYVRQNNSEPTSVKSACIGAGVPASTALRWIGVLENEGLVSSVGDAGDHRRRLVRLTDQAFKQMTTYLIAISS